MKGNLIKRGEGDYKLFVNDTPFGQSKQSPYKKLSIKNCKFIENGYDLDELAELELKKETAAFFFYNNTGFIKGFHIGFKKAIELLGDKKFSEKDVLKELNKLITMPNSTLDTFTDDDEMVTMKWFEQHPKQTEWEVEIELQEVISYDDIDKPGFLYKSYFKPRLDVNGCLILKRVI